MRHVLCVQCAKASAVRVLACAAPTAPALRARGRRYGDKGRTAKEGGLSAHAKRLKELMEHAAQFPEEYSKARCIGLA